MTNPSLGRELRSAKLELRDAVGDDGRYVAFEGYGTVWEHSYDVYGGVELGGWVERVAKGAAAKTLSEGGNKALLYQHSDSRVLATTRTGLLTMSEDDIGLLVRAELDTSVSWIADLVRQIESGTIDEMSIGFYAMRSEWNANFTDRTIREIKLVEASVVWAGANDATVAAIADRARATVAEARRNNGAQYSARLRAELLAEADRLRRAS